MLASSEAAERELYALPTDNGVTGYVAATGNSYLCRDTSHDPLYLTGIDNASSSLTVPIKRHDRVLGTFNVEYTCERIHRAGSAVHGTLLP